jgi:G:T-mismatch repair DNA endonuclease (very short patch repair protein)
MTTNKICKFCEKNIEKTVSIHNRYCEKYKEFINSITKEDLIDMYINKKMSCLDIQKAFGISHHSIIYRKMKEFNIQIRSGSDCGKLSESKRRDTLIKKTGFPHNFCKGGKIRNKVEEDLKNKGVTNWFQLDSVKLKSRKTLLEKYGVECSYQVDTIRGGRTYSKIHKQIVDICHNLKIDVGIEFKLKKDNEFRYYSYDIILNNTNKIIEVYGDYWHGNPLIYKETDLLLRGSSREMSVGHKWEFDKVKNNFAVSKGYFVMILWEYDINKELDKISDLILNYSSTKQTSPILNSSTLL